MKKKILFICSPSVGILDNVLPVIENYQLEYSFDIFLPKKNTLEQFSIDDYNVNISLKCFKHVVFCDGDFLNFYNYKDSIKKINQINSFFYKLENILYSCNFFKFSNKLNSIYEHTIKKVFNKFKIFFFFKTAKRLKKYKLCNLNYSAIFFDAYEYEKPYLKKIQSQIDKLPKFSFHHGSDQPIRNKKNKIMINNCNFIQFTKFKNEKKYFRSFISPKSKNNKILPLGNPKHDKNWVKKILRQKSDISQKFKKYIFLISRNDDPNYHPYSRKKKSLYIIKKYIISKKYKLIIKLHPKENVGVGSEIYYRTFGRQSYNKTWSFSKNHPIKIASKSIFNISFFSGVAVDLLLLKSPTIELLNLKGLENKNPGQIFYQNSEPVFRIRKQGYVLGASNENDFKKLIDKLHNNTIKTSLSVVNNFNKNYIKTSIKKYQKYLKQIL